MTISLVPATKMVGEKATRCWRSRLLVVEPHSRSAWPFTMASKREAAVTGTQVIVSGLCTVSEIAATSALHSSIE